MGPQFVFFIAVIILKAALPGLKKAALESKTPLDDAAVQVVEVLLLAHNDGSLAAALKK